jgi:tetratricopeptide (TPR) repeat protein
MSQSPFTSDWLNKFSDPFAVLGVTVAADDRRIRKRYHQVSLLIHPDGQVQVDDDDPAKKFASQLFARLFSPSYEKVKQEKGRAEVLALLRFNARRLGRETPLKPEGKLARELMQQPVNGVDVFYEQAIARLSASQYDPLEQFEALTLELGELNLVYLWLKTGEVFVGEKRTGLVAATEAKPVQFTPAPAKSEAASENYAQRHYRRAQEYMKKGNWHQAVQELRDAIKIEPDKSDYHALLGVAYLQQNLSGMAKVYIGQALKLNPNDPLATKWAAKVGIASSSSTNNQNGATARSQPNKDAQKGGFFNFFRAKK